MVHPVGKKIKHTHKFPPITEIDVTVHTNFLQLLK
jgi:hypothetical protein